MSLKRPKGHPGTLVVLEHNSKVLKGNPLGDPHWRKLDVWLPPQYDIGRKNRFPVLYDLDCFTGSGLAHAHWAPLGDNVPERAARLIHKGSGSRWRGSLPAVFRPAQRQSATAFPRWIRYPGQDLTSDVIPYGFDCAWRYD